MARTTKTEREEAIKSLREMLRPGDKVYTILRNVSRSGMSRTIDLVCNAREVELTYPPMPAARADYPGQVDYNAKPKRRTVRRVRNIGWLAAKAMNDRFDHDANGIKIGGCGMDMGFALVYNLGCTLWPKGTPKPHGTRNGAPDSAGGYALKQEWL